jgi:thiol-disulfide isomerase/thioredoxin
MLCLFLFNAIHEKCVDEIVIILETTIMDKQERKMSSRVSFSISFLFLLLLGAFLCSSCFVFTKRYWSDPPTFPDSSELKSMGTLDEDWVFYTLNGEEKSFEDFKGKVVFLTVWATWCSACQSELPGIQRLYDSMMGEKVIFMLLSNEGDSTLREFVETSGLTVPVYMYKDELQDVLKTPVVPRTYIIDRQGSIVFSHFGAARWEDLTTRKFLRELQ